MIWELSKISFRSRSLQQLFWNVVSKFIHKPDNWFTAPNVILFPHNLTNSTICKHMLKVKNYLLPFMNTLKRKWNTTTIARVLFHKNFRQIEEIVRVFPREIPWNQFFHYIMQHVDFTKKNFQLVETRLSFFHIF